MKYEFHVGNYVEMSPNSIGWLNGFYKQANVYTFFFHWKNGSATSWQGRMDELPGNIIRIGKYDFTKPEQPKEIKKLPDGYGDGYVLYKGVTEVDGTVENGWVSIGVLSSKINELVAAVNELRNK